MQNQTDEQLVKAYLKGNEQALELLVERYLSPLYNFAFKYVHTPAAAEDVVQEALVKIWKNINKFNKKFKFKTWAYTITKNTALDHLKKKGMVAVPEGTDEQHSQLLEALVSHDPLPQQAMEAIDNAVMVKTAVAKLPGKYRQIISLYYDQGFNFREIAQNLKESINTIKTRHRRAVLYLKKQIVSKD